MLGDGIAGAQPAWVALGTNHISWRFAQSETIQFRTGIGTRHWVDGLGHELGFDFVYGFEVMLGRPLVLNAYGHLGSLGSAFVWQVRAGLGLMLKRMELFAAYDHLRIGSVDLGGPTLGARLWL